MPLVFPAINRKTGKPRVHLMGGDAFGWALDLLLEQTRRAMAPFVEFTSLADAGVVHSTNMDHLLALPREALSGKRVVCYLPGEPARFLALPSFWKLFPLVSLWLTPSCRAEGELRAMGVPCRRWPQAADPLTFHPLPPDDPVLSQWRARWGIPGTGLVIANFNRDSQGRNLLTPKLEKGPDLFVEILRLLQARGVPCHALLAGPRRHWLRRELTRFGLPFTYVGNPVAGDDIRGNILTRDDLNRLYNLSDLCLVTSRSEGGPYSLLESICARRPVLSTRVGMSEDLLVPTSLYDDPRHAADTLARHAATRMLDDTIAPQHQRMMEIASPAAVSTLLGEIYRQLPAYPVVAAPCCSRVRDFGRKVRRRLLPATLPVIAAWGAAVAPGSALGRQLRGAGLHLVAGGEAEAPALHLVAGGAIAEPRLLDALALSVRPLIHRLDARAAAGEWRRVLDGNARSATATVVPSAWTLAHYRARGASLIRPLIVPDPADPRLLAGENVPDLVVVVTADEELGTANAVLRETLSRASWPWKELSARSEEEAAGLMARARVVVTLAAGDAVLPAVQLAVARGVPVLAPRESASAEQVQMGGLFFAAPDEIPRRLERLLMDRELFSRLATPVTWDDAAERYLALVREILA